MRLILARVVLTAAVAAAMLAAPVEAGAGVTTVSYGFRVDPTLAPFVEAAAAQLFDPSLGSLISVEIEYKTTISANWAITNPGSRSETGTFNTTVDAALASPGSLVDQINNQTTGDIPFTVGPHRTKNQNATQNSISDATYTSAGILSQFTGVGTINLTETTSVTNVLDGSASLSFTNSTFADATGVITYTYNAVPEPATLMLGAIGVLSALGCGIRRRLRSAKA